MAHDTPIEKHYIKQGQEIIDILFDKGYFVPEVKRQDMRHLDELLGFYLQSSAESAVRVDRMLRRVRDTK